LSSIGPYDGPIASWVRGEGKRKDTIKKTVQIRIARRRSNSEEKLTFSPFQKKPTRQEESRKQHTIAAESFKTKRFIDFYDRYFLWGRERSRGGVGGRRGCIVLSGFLLLNAGTCTAHMLLHLMRWAWMKEEKGIIHQGWGAHLRCPVCTSVQFSLRNEDSTEYMCVRGEITGDNIYRCQSVCPVVLNDFDFFKENITTQTLWSVQNWISTHIY
jgi:hypothetical protein